MDLETVDHLLTTTRSVRKRLDLARAVEPEILERCIDIAMQAPSGSNRQRWHFLVVTDEARRQAIADYYRRSFTLYAQGRVSPSASSDSVGGDPVGARADKVFDSALYLAEHMHEVPVLLLACIDGRVESSPQGAQAGLYGSILPAVWSLMLALRARGIGAAWTTLHLAYAAEVGALLGIPENVTQAALLPIAYFTGDDFRPARRIPATERTYWNQWQSPRA